MDMNRYKETLRRRRPQQHDASSFEDYCCQMDAEESDDACFFQAVRSRGLRRKLEVACLCLEVGACVTIIVAALAATKRALFR